MKKDLLLFFLIFNLTCSLAQSHLYNGWGTIKVRKVQLDKTLPKLVAKKKPGIRIFFGRFNGSNYKITFPKSYQAELFPLVFNGRGLILTDENKTWTDNKIIDYNYEIAVGNAMGKRSSATEWDINRIIAGLPVGQYLWISGLNFSDSTGIIHNSEIGEFKVERLD